MGLVLASSVYHLILTEARMSNIPQAPAGDMSTEVSCISPRQMGEKVWELSSRLSWKDKSREAVG